MWPQADIVFLQVPLFPSTRHMINDDVLPKLKKGMTLINTSRGGERQDQDVSVVSDLAGQRTIIAIFCAGVAK